MMNALTLAQVVVFIRLKNVSKLARNFEPGAAPTYRQL